MNQQLLFTQLIKGVADKDFKIACESMSLLPSLFDQDLLKKVLKEALKSSFQDIRIFAINKIFFLENPQDREELIDVSLSCSNNYEKGIIIQQFKYLKNFQIMEKFIEKCINTNSEDVAEIINFLPQEKFIYFLDKLWAFQKSSVKKVLISQFSFIKNFEILKQYLIKALTDSSEEVSFEIVNEFKNIKKRR